MRKLNKRLGVGVGIFLAGSMALFAAQDSGPSGVGKQSGGAAPAVVDHAQAYYHFMLARRYKELAGVTNRTEFIDKAVSEYKQAIAADPETLFLRVELAELYWRNSQVGDAIREAEDVLKADPNYPDAHQLLARIYWHLLGESQTETSNKENLHKAIEHMEALTRLQPSDTDSWQVLGRLYKMDNQNQKAEEAFKKVLDVDPDSKGGLSSLAQLYFEQGDYAGAVDLLKKIPEADQDPPMLGMLGYAYSQMHDFESAVATYEKALAKDPENQELHRAYADALLDTGNTPAARTEFEKILKADPEDGSTYLRLAQLDRQEGRFDEARKDLERARTLSLPGDAKIQYNTKIQYEQALLEDAAGNQDKAIELLQGLVKSSEQPEVNTLPLRQTIAPSSWSGWGGFTAASGNTRSLCMPSNRLWRSAKRRRHEVNSLSLTRCA